MNVEGIKFAPPPLIPHAITSLFSRPFLCPYLRLSSLYPHLLSIPRLVSFIGKSENAEDAGLKRDQHQLESKVHFIFCSRHAKLNYSIN